MNKNEDFTQWGSLRANESEILKTARKILKELQFGEVKIARGATENALTWWATIEQIKPTVYLKGGE